VEDNDQAEMAIVSLESGDSYQVFSNIMMSLEEYKSNVIMYATYEEAEIGDENILFYNILSFLSMNMISNYLAEKFYFSNQANVVKYYVNYFKLNENIYISDQLQLKLS
jgi:hypothetical protein